MNKVATLCLNSLSCDFCLVQSFSRVTYIKVYYYMFIVHRYTVSSIYNCLIKFYFILPKPHDFEGPKKSLCIFPSMLFDSDVL